MEYIIIGIIALIIFIVLLVILKVKAVRDRANALFLEAEKHITEDKFNYVCENLYSFLSSTRFGSIITFFLKEKAFNEMIQKLYDKTRNLAKDLLDDGKRNKSNEEE